MNNDGKITKDARSDGPAIAEVVPSNLPARHAANALVPVSMEAGDEDVTVYVPPEGKHTLRHKFRAAARREKRRAAAAGNAANTSQQIAIGIGGTLGTSGIVAIATATGPLTAAGALATVSGIVIAALGLVASHVMNGRKLLHQELAEEYQDKVEDLR